MLLSSDNNFPAAEQNMYKERGKWGGLENLLGREGADRRITGRSYVAVVQAVLIFGSKTWLLIPRLDKSLESFHHCVVWRMAVMGPKRQQDRTWVYTPIGEVLATVRPEDIGVYIS